MIVELKIKASYYFIIKINFLYPQFYQNTMNEESGKLVLIFVGADFICLFHKHFKVFFYYLAITLILYSLTRGRPFSNKNNLQTVRNSDSQNELK